MDKIAEYKDQIYKEASNKKNENKTKFWKDRVIPGAMAGAAMIPGQQLSKKMTAKYTPHLIRRGVQEAFGGIEDIIKAEGLKDHAKAMLKMQKKMVFSPENYMATRAALPGAALSIAGVAGVNGYRLKKLHEKEFGKAPTKGDYAKTMIIPKVTPLGVLAGTPEAVIKAKKRKAAKAEKHAAIEEFIMDKVAKSKEDNETKFWKDRFVPAFKAGLGGLGGATIGGETAAIIAREGFGRMKGPRAIGQIIGGTIGSAGVNAYRLNKLHEKEFKKKPTGEDYAKTTLTGAAGQVLSPYTGGLSGFVAPFMNTPEAIVKAKKREKTAEEYKNEIHKIAWNAAAAEKRISGLMKRINIADDAVKGANAARDEAMRANKTLKSGNKMLKGIATVGTVGGVAGGTYGAMKANENRQIKQQVGML